MLDLAEGGIDDAKYRPLPGGGPTLAAACDDRDHEFSPAPSDLHLDSIEQWHGGRVPDTYHRLVRCRTCGLSGSVLGQFLGHELPFVCDRCGTESMPSEDPDRAFSPNPEWTDAFLCGSCASDVAEEYEAYDVSCYRCGVSLGTNEDNQYVPAQSLLGERLGADEDDSADVLFVCDPCREAVLDDTPL